MNLGDLRFQYLFVLKKGIKKQLAEDQVYPVMYMLD